MGVDFDPLRDRRCRVHQAVIAAIGHDADIGGAGLGGGCGLKSEGLHGGEIRSGSRQGGGHRDGGGKPFRGDRDRDDRDDRKPRGKPGWDGKPREKKYFRKENQLLGLQPSINSRVEWMTICPNRFQKGESIPHIGDLIFTSRAPEYSINELTSIKTSSHTFSIYYPETRPHLKDKRYIIVASLNARWDEWANLNDEEYQAEKARICEECLSSLETFIPDVREKIDHIEAATPRTVNHYTKSMQGTSFGTKFEGLKVSMELPDQIEGLYRSMSATSLHHTGFTERNIKGKHGKDFMQDAACVLKY